jgi:hypothetical protein
MAAIINALFGTYPETATTEATIESNTAITTERLHTSAVADDVHVKSVISSETQANATLNNQLNIENLLSQLSTTHSQVDQYSRARTAAINAQVHSNFSNHMFSFFLNRFNNRLLMYLLELNVNKKNY